MTDASALADLSVDPVAAVVGVLAIIVAFAIYRKQVAKPRLTYEIRATSLVTLRQEAEGLLKITLDGDEVSGLYLVESRFANTGSTAIRSADFEESLTVTLGEGSMPLGIDVVEAEPKGLKLNIDLHDGALEVKPLLLNPGDGFRIKALVRDFSGPAELRAPRVAGLTRVVDSQAPTFRSTLWERFDRAVPGVLALLAAVFLVVELGPNLWDEMTGRGETEVELNSGAKICGEPRDLALDDYVVLEIDDEQRVIPKRDIVSTRKVSC